MARSTANSVAAALPPAEVPHLPAAPDLRELERAKDDSLLQLRIGRSAHYYAVIVSGLLLIDGFLVLLLQPSTIRASPIPPQDLVFLAFPLMSGLYLAFFSLRIKWEAYQLWPWELHFWVSFLSVALNVAVGFLYVSSLFDIGPTGRWPLLPGFYPLSLAGISLPLLGLSLTWSEWSERKIVGTIAALLPIPISLALFLPPVNGAASASALALTLFAGAVLFQMSGSFLHLISSGTRRHEREVISSSQSRLVIDTGELRQREESLEAKAREITHREVEVEMGRVTLSRAREAHEVSVSQLELLEADVTARAAALSEERHGWAVHVADVQARDQMAADKEEALVLREGDLHARLPRLADREQRLAQGEGELARREAGQVRLEQDLERRQAAASEGEARIDARRKELDARAQELSRLDSELRSREALVLSPPHVDASTRARVAELEQREARLSHLQLVLDEQNRTLGRRSREVEDVGKGVRERGETVVAHQAELARREGELSQREAEAKERTELAVAREKEYGEILHSHEQKIRTLNEREATIEGKAADLERVAAQLRLHETTAHAEGERLLALRKELDRRERAVTEREASARARPALSTAPTPAAPIAETPSGAPRAIPRAASRAPSIPSPAAPAPGRASTGTARLDDLLRGGLPSSAQVLLTGPAAESQEMLVYSFLAAGRRLGEPAIVVTMGRGVGEIEGEAARSNPELFVRTDSVPVVWVDASGSPDPTRSADPHTITVRDASDHVGILRGVIEAVRRAQSGTPGPVRVGVFGLSNVFAQRGERAALVFVQNLLAILRPHHSLGVYANELDGLTDEQLHALGARMDAVITFRRDGDRTFLSVAGLEDVATREWVECRATDRSLVLGSFAIPAA